MPALRASQGGEGAGILWKDGIQLTINEYETLMGFPVDYTLGFGTVARRRKAGERFRRQSSVGLESGSKGSEAQPASCQGRRKRPY